MAAPLSAAYRLDGANVSLVVEIIAEVPAVRYWGPRLLDDLDPAELSALAARAEANASPAYEAPLALTPQAGQGFPGRPGLTAHRGGLDWASYALLVDVEQAADRLVFTSRDDAHGLELVHDLQLSGDVLAATTRLTNIGAEALQVDHLAAPVIPLPGFVGQIIGFEGRWSGEFQLRRQDLGMGTWLHENRRGRTSHDAFPGLLATERDANETRGLAFGFHLGWSGNHRLSVETLADGRRSVAMEALFMPGEISLAPGESLTTPAIFATVSDAGLGAVSRHYHAFLRARPEHQRLRAKPRPVHYNSWEAVYFDHDQQVLMALAEKAAAVGVERFVLDDGWFGSRRSDRAGLGDWQVSPDVYPQGLGPLIDKVRALGMEFGLWVEPEMVNPDSDLFRAHPEWVLGTPPAPQIPFRHQLVLDFGRPEVRERMYADVATLLEEYPIAYLKWDMNRDLSQPGGADGRGGATAHVLGLYEVLDRLRASYPAVEIESCASGGGRADFGILARTDRVWTSDSNDALDRLSIQRGFSHFFPAELMGAHVGPTRCHITGRVLSMPLRVATALFGHMGIEADLRALDAEETADLAAGVALHKAHRDLIHTGALHRIDAAEGVNAFAVMAEDGGEALVSYTMLTEQRGYFAEPLRLAGLNPAAEYDLKAVWPPRLKAEWPLKQGGRFRGAALMQAGFHPPRLHPGTAVILHLKR
ncbi:MAG: alpha-galactosidase [Sphingomonadales bacterium]|nr:alpha-galactosidase [Sphingomonadales bacterium]